MKIYLATDHAGFELKEKIKTWLQKNDYEIEDFGAHELNPSDDYPDFISKAAEAVSECEKEAKSSPSTGSGQTQCRGIVFGGSGQGEAMVTDRYENVRTALYYGGNMEVVKLSREHNDANILSLGARFVTEDEALEAVKLWLETSFSGEERHKRRLGKF